MKNIKKEQTERLEIRMNDAADGLLNLQEIAALEKELQDHPDLLIEYHNIMNLPDFSNIYGGLKEHQNRDEISLILKKIGLIENQQTSMNFGHITVLWFKKYAIAASFLILGITSIFNLSQPDVTEIEIAYEELFYPESDIATDEYVTYLNEWIEP